MSVDVMTWDIGPSEGGRKWTLDEVQTYHNQCIALALARIANELSRTSGAARDWCDRYQEADAALSLVMERDEITSWFDDVGHMRLADFMNRHREVYGWSALHGRPVEAINRTNYLRAERRGRGYRVVLVEDDYNGPAYGGGDAVETQT